MTLSDLAKYSMTQNVTQQLSFLLLYVVFGVQPS